MKETDEKRKKSRLQYTDEAVIKALFSFMAIRVESISKNFGSPEDFALAHDLYGVTNGEILVICEMSEPPPFLYQIADEILEPAGLKLYNDYVIAFEQYVMTEDIPENSPVLPKGPSNLNKPIPLCDKTTWLGSIISETGNYVWDKTKHDIRPDQGQVPLIENEGKKENKRELSPGEKFLKILDETPYTYDRVGQVFIITRMHGLAVKNDNKDRSDQ